MIMIMIIIIVVVVFVVIISIIIIIIINMIITLSTFFLLSANGLCKATLPWTEEPWADRRGVRMGHRHTDTGDMHTQARYPHPDRHGTEGREGGRRSGGGGGGGEGTNQEREQPRLSAE